MNNRASSRAACAVVLLCLSLMAACQPDDKCDPGYTFMLGVCSPPAMMPAPGPGDAGPGDDGGGDTDKAPNNFGKACSAATDCAGGAAPVCAPAPFSACTQQNCMAGEAHAGACPSGWTCLAIPANPSACVNF